MTAVKSFCIFMKLRNAFLHCRPSIKVWYLPKFTACGLLQDDARVWQLFWLHMRFIINKWQAGYSEEKLVQTISLWQGIHTGVHAIFLILAVLPNYSCLSSSCYFCFFQFTWVYALLIWFSIPIITSVLSFFYLFISLSKSSSFILLQMCCSLSYEMVAAIS